MLNRIIIMGRLGKDPEIRHTQSGTLVGSFRLAVDRDFKDKNTGERPTDWIDVVAWRNTAEFAEKYLAKGRMVVVEGRLQMREWTDKNGGRRISAEVVADNLYFADSRRDDAGGGYQQPGGYPSGGNQGGYGGGYQGGYGGDFRRAADSSPAPGPGDFSEMDDDDDGQLPF